MLAPPSDPADWDDQAPPPRFGPAALVALALARWRIVAAIVFVTTTAAFLYSQFVLARDPLFKAAATLDIAPSQAQLEFGNAFARGNALQSAGLLTQTYAEYATSRPVIEAIAEDYLAEHPEALEQKPGGLGIRRTIRMLDEGGPAVRDPRTMFADTLRKSIDVASVEGTHLLRIQVLWGEPAAAAAIANEVADRLIAEADARSAGPTAALNRSIADRLAETREALNQRQIEAAQVRASLGVADVQRQKEALIEERLAEESRLVNERAQIASSSAQVGQLQRQSDGLLSSATPVVEQTLAVERPRLAGLQQSVRQRAARVGQLNAQLARLGRSETRLGILDREIEALKLQVAALADRYNAVELETLAGAPPIRVVERAAPPLARDSPRVVTNTILGFLGGCALAGLFLLVAPRPGTRFVATREPLPQPFAGRRYEGALRRPGRRRSFTPEESRDISARLQDLLAGPLADPSRALYVLASHRDADAVAVYNLLAAFLKSRGETVNAPEAAEADGAQLVRTRSRALIYCGGLGESGHVPPARENEELILVAPGRSGREALAGLERTLADSGWTQPYLIRLDQ